MTDFSPTATQAGAARRRAALPHRWASNDTNQPQVPHTSRGTFTDKTCLMPEALAVAKTAAGFVGRAACHAAAKVTDDPQ